MAHIRQPRPDSGLGFEAEVRNSFEGVPSALGRGCPELEAVPRRARI